MRRRLGALTGVLVLLAAGPARAHELVVECTVLAAEKKVQVYAWYSSPRNPHPARQAQVEVTQAGSELARGATGDDGHFAFAYDRAEEVRVTVSQAGHVGAVTLSAAQLANGEEGKTPADTATASGRADSPLISSRDQRPFAWVKDVLVGVGFLLALAAFVLSVRNARQISRWGRGR
jgi:hypothetical protein